MLPKLSFLIVAIVALLGQPFGSQAQALDNSVKPIPSVAQPGDNFLGDWEWNNGGEVFHITLERNAQWPVPFSPTHRTANVILGNFRYTRNGTVIAESVRAPASADNGLFYSKLEPRKMVMTFYDMAHGKSGLVTLRFLSQANNQITWSMQRVEEGLLFNTAPSDFSVPTAITLTRQ